MIILNVAITMYTICTFMTVADEIWNIKNPRPYPKQKYYAMQWEEKDFYTKKYKEQWILRKHRKTDSETKKIAREKYWKKRK